MNDIINAHSNTNVPDYNSASSLSAFLQSRGLCPRKKWGQNFLINPNARAFLLDSLELKKGCSVWEIGSGLGAMTDGLLKRGMQVTAFEIDPSYCAILQELFSGPRFALIKGDALKTWKSAPPAPYLFGNLPYVIAAILMGNLIEGGRIFNRMVITVQKEVAHRMIAKPGSKDYSSLSVLFASAYSGKIIMTLKGASFYPVPHVDSAALCFDKLPDYINPPPLFYPLVRSLFAARRKTIANNLQIFIGSSGILTSKALKEAAMSILASCGLKGSERAEQLPVQVFINIAKSLSAFKAGNGVD